MELRRHYTQMETPEIAKVLSDVRRCLNYPLTAYAEERISERHLPPNYLAALLSYGKVVELRKVNIGTPNEDLRVLLRGRIRGDDVSAVLSLTKRLTITAYLNRKTKTRDKSAYTWKEIYEN